MFNYQNGHRVFEVDLSFSKDGFLVGRHEWADWTYTYAEQRLDEGVRNFLPQTLEQIEKQDDYYTTITFDKICEILLKYEDVYFVTDTKGFEKNDVKQTFEYIVKKAKEYDERILDRLIVQVYNQEMYWEVKKIYDFKSVIYTLYASSDTVDEVLDFVKETKIKVVTMPIARCTKEFVRGLRKLDCLVFVHTVNKVSDMKKYLDMGIYGFYTDNLKYDLFNFEDYYDEHNIRSEIAQSSSFKEYFEKIIISNYDLIITLNAENSNAEIECLKEIYNYYGLSTETLSKAKESYVAILKNGKIISEKNDIKTETISDVVFEHSQTNNKPHINIIIDSVLYKQNNSLLNIIVYDKNNTYIVDNSSFVSNTNDILDRIYEDSTDYNYMYLYKLLDDMDSDNYKIDMTITQKAFNTLGNDILNKINDLKIEYKLTDDITNYEIKINVYDKTLEKNIAEITL